MRGALVYQRLGDCHLKRGNVAVAESLGHRVVGGHLRLGVAEPSLRGALVDQRLGDRHLNLG